MIRRLDLRTDPTAELPRAQQDVEHALHVVGPLCDDVRARGEEAVLEYGERFDGVRPASLRVAPEYLEKALADLDPAIRAGLEESIARLRTTCEAELEQTVVTTVAPGATVERRIVPMQRVGLYVPGGLAPLVSTVVMNTVPAQVAGVGSIALTSPPQAEFDGLPPPTILAACALLGIDEAGSDALFSRLSAGHEMEKPGWVRLNLSWLHSDDEVTRILDGVATLAASAEDCARDYACDPLTARFRHHADERQSA